VGRWRARRGWRAVGGGSADGVAHAARSVMQTFVRAEAAAAAAAAAAKHGSACVDPRLVKSTTRRERGRADGRRLCLCAGGPPATSLKRCAQGPLLNFGMPLESRVYAAPCCTILPILIVRTNRHHARSVHAALQLAMLSRDGGGRRQT
jgi:hypothetical protein